MNPEDPEKEETMRTVKENKRSVYEINRSRFCAVLYPLDDIDQAKVFLKQTEKDYPKADHYCYAYRFDGYEKNSDDGEPGGTAGRPILETLKNRNLDRILCVVVRYFGGIKLGASNLARSYANAARSVLEKATVYQAVDERRYVISVDYSDSEGLKSYLNRHAITIESVAYEEKVKFSCSAENLDVGAIVDRLNGRVALEEKELHRVYRKAE